MAIQLIVAALLLTVAAGQPSGCSVEKLPAGWSSYRNATAGRTYLINRAKLTNAEARAACQSFGAPFDLVVFDSQEQQKELESSIAFIEGIKNGMAYYHLGLYMRSEPVCPPVAAQPRWVNTTWYTDPSYCFVNDTANDYATSFWRVDGRGPAAPYPMDGNETYVYTHWTSSGSVQWGWEPNSGSNCTVADRRMAFKSFLGSSRADMLKPYMWLKGLPVQRTWGWADLGSRSCAAKVNAICYAQCSPQDVSESTTEAPPPAREVPMAPGQKAPVGAGVAGLAGEQHKGVIARTLRQQGQQQQQQQLGCGLTRMPPGWLHYQNTTDGRVYMLRSSPLSNADARTVCHSLGPKFDLVTFDSYEQQLELERSPAFAYLEANHHMRYYHLGYYLDVEMPPCPPAGEQPRWMNNSWYADPGYCFVNDTSDALGTAFRRVVGGMTAPLPFRGNETYVYTHWGHSGSPLWGQEPNSASNCTVADKGAAYQVFLGTQRADMAREESWMRHGTGNVWGWADLGSRDCSAKVHAICSAKCTAQGAPQQPAAAKQAAPQATSSASTLAAKLRKAPRSSALVADLSKSLRVKLPLVQHEPLPAGNLTVLPDMFMPFGARPLSELFASVINTTALGLAAEGMGMVEGTGVMGIV